MINLYKEYIKEREDLELISNDFGFITYRIEKDHLFIDNLYITKEKRNKGEANKLLQMVYNLNPHNRIFCAVCIDANNWKESKKFIEHVGYRESHKEYTMIFFSKEI